MKTSSVTVNVVVTVGCMVIFMGTLMILLTYGVKQYGISEGESTALCYVRSIFCTYFMCYSTSMISYVGKSLYGSYWIHFV